MGELLEERTEDPTENAGLQIYLTRDGVKISSKGVRITLLVITVLALVTLPIFLLWMQVEHDLPMRFIYFADVLGTAAIVFVAIMAMFGNGKKPR